MQKDTVKNIVGKDTIYKKHQSFGDFKTKNKDYAEVFMTLDKLHEELHADPNKTYQNEILQRVFKDINNPQPTHDQNKNSPIQFKLNQNVLEDLSRLETKNYKRYLFYRYRYEIFPQTFEVDGFPPCLQIEPTSVCNFRCVFCYQTDQSFTDNKNSHMGTMTLDLFKKIVDEAEGKCEAITLASRGEPLICKDIGKMLEYMEGKFLATKMNTNASLLTEKRCHEILSSGLHTLVFSVDAAVEPLYSQLRVNGSLEKTLKNIRLFCDIKNKHYSQTKMITRVAGVKVSDNQNIKDMEDVWGDLVDQLAFVHYNPWENTYQRPLSDVTKPCSDLWRRAFVWYDGIINPCDVDYKSYLKVGNAKNDSVSELWQEGLYKELRENHLKNKRNNIEPCKKCTVI